MQEALKQLSRLLPADAQPAEVLDSGNRTFYFAVSAVALQRPTTLRHILRRGLSRK